MSKKAHLTEEGLKDIINIKTSMNLGLSDMLKTEFKLMESIIKYLGSGKIQKYPGKLAVSISIVKYTDITEIIIPFFLK